MAIKKLYRPFQSELFAKRAYRELRLLKHMRHENVSPPQMRTLCTGHLSSCPPLQILPTASASWGLVPPSYLASSLSKLSAATRREVEASQTSIGATLQVFSPRFSDLVSLLVHLYFLSPGSGQGTF